MFPVRRVLPAAPGIGRGVNSQEDETMKTITTALGITLVGLLGAAPSAWGADETFARATERTPQQAAALVRGFAAGNGWHVTEEMSVRGGEVIGLQLCQNADEIEPIMLCGQFAILGNGAASEIILLHVGTALPAPANGDDLMGATRRFSAVLDAASAPAIARGDNRFRCDANGCP
jgi:hypothetical protein